MSATLFFDQDQIDRESFHTVLGLGFEQSSQKNFSRTLNSFFMIFVSNLEVQSRTLRKCRQSCKLLMRQLQYFFLKKQQWKWRVKSSFWVQVSKFDHKMKHSKNAVQHKCSYMTVICCHLCYYYQSTNTTHYIVTLHS